MPSRKVMHVLCVGQMVPSLFTLAVKYLMSTSNPFRFVGPPVFTLSVDNLCSYDVNMLWQGDHNHLYVRQGTGLQGQAVFKEKLSMRPHSTESFTHRKMTRSLADRSAKTQRVKVLSQVGSNPEANREDLIKVRCSFILSY